MTDILQITFTIQQYFLELHSSVFVHIYLKFVRKGLNDSIISGITPVIQGNQVHNNWSK